VEDHSNQLVRTFTGNLTKMLSHVPAPFKAGLSENGAAGSGSSNSALAATAAAAAAAARAPPGRLGGSAGGVAPPEWTATRLMQTFSGPVRRRFGTRSWGLGATETSNDGGSGSSSSKDAPASGPAVGQDPAAAAGTLRPAAAAGADAAAGGKRAKAAGRGLTRTQHSVSRIDEGEAGEEQ
jgi:hypothetical protein